MPSRASLAVGAALAAAALTFVADAHAVGEEKAGFPKWAERVQHEWTNRARVDPALEMTKCGTPCAEGSCYSVKPPLYWNEWASHASRFHSTHMTLASYFAHDSKCALVSNIKDVYPSPCAGGTSCACVGGTLTGTTTAATRVGMFGVPFEGEIIAYGYGGDPDKLFYLWLYEPSTTTGCTFTSANGHRWLLLTATGSVGFGVYTDHSSGDFSTAAGEVNKIASGSHYPKNAASVELWANWYDTAGGPKTALVNVGGTCSPMALTRGTATNGAYKYTATGLSGCTRYYFTYTDSAGTKVDYPTTGSLGIGDATCADWDTTRPAPGSGCGPCTPSCSGKTCGPDGCGGSCGTCAAGTTCSTSGTCVCTPACSGLVCGPDGCGGTCGTCPSGKTCSAGACIDGPCTPSCSGKTCGPDGCGGTCAPGCTAPETCGTAGTCDCTTPNLKCGTSCTDPSSDPLNCGACGTKCATGEVCSKGKCAGSCTAPLVDCGGSCVDLAADPRHCGDCGTVCKAGEGCSSGKCTGPGPSDSGPIDDSGTLPDSGVPGLDPNEDTAIHGSCGCQTPGGDAGNALALGGLSLAIATVLARRRRK